MKKLFNSKLILILAIVLACTFVLITNGCSRATTSVRVFTEIENINEYISNHNSGSTVDDPIPLVLNINLQNMSAYGSNWQKLIEIIYTQGRFIALDISNSTMSGTEFDPRLEGDTFIVSIAIPNNTTLIGESAFYNCINLADVKIPDSVTAIGRWAFFNCTGINSIIIPSSVKSIGPNVFSGWTSSQTIYINGHTSQNSADEEWGYSPTSIFGVEQYFGWRANCNAQIVYQGQ